MISLHFFLLRSTSSPSPSLKLGFQKSQINGSQKKKTTNVSVVATTTATTTPTRNTRRRTSTQRQREEAAEERERVEEEASKNSTSKLSALAEQARVIAESEATAVDQEEKSQEEGGIDSSKNEDASVNEDVEVGEEDRGVGDEVRTKYRHDRPIPEETRTSNSAESSSDSASGDDTSLIKLVRYSDYKFVIKMDEHLNLTGGVTVKSGLGKSFSEFRKILKHKK